MKRVFSEIDSGVGGTPIHSHDLISPDGEWRCIECFINMGSGNSRQLCGKWRCLSPDFCHICDQPMKRPDICDQPIKRPDVHLEKLHTVGYTILEQVFDPSELLPLIIKQSDRAQPIFNHNEMSPRNDHKRLQCNLKVTKKIRQYIDMIRDYVNQNLKIDEDQFTYSHYVILHSRPGCKRQASHCDYVPTRDLGEASDSQMHLAILVALMPDTYLDVSDHSIRLCTADKESLNRVPGTLQSKTFKLNPGDILVFRGDLIHEGSAYDKDNYRLHSYIDSVDVQRTPNRTWLVKQHGTKLFKV